MVGIQENQTQEDQTQSPNSGELASYEDYLRRELPRNFGSILENAVNSEVESRLRGQIMDLLEQAQNITFDRYRALQSTHTSESVADASLDRQNRVISTLIIQLMNWTEFLKVFRNQYTSILGQFLNSKEQ